MLPRAKKSYGQNFLIDQSVVDKILVAAEITKGESILEIGPGTGLLTQALVGSKARVVAVELDHDLIEPLVNHFGDKIELIEGDILRLETLPVEDRAYKLIANIPYNITSPIIEKFLTQAPRPSRMILMVQREVADRIVAKPPQMSLLSVVCQLYANCSRVVNVRAGSFRPIPKVDSAVVQFDLKHSSDPLAERIIHLAKMGFISKRKQLHHNLLPYLRVRKPEATSEDVKAMLVSIGHDPRVRAENLTIEDWVKLEKRMNA
ncbi:MAG: 16S rRNA (adenine(1518)-N(6)/adenine(1519)-N(6))-dimethyltransferase RsmA [Candidatus Uhrbacteria bacterium]|nr:16S rRNA (adenine(1518)-N(6)/adenine(1519)-N(6))-dimethyltransferase RsmA [Candidatus Uhrbacteria bacterium]